jgi:hypothetical protein
MKSPIETTYQVMALRKSKREKFVSTSSQLPARAGYHAHLAISEVQPKAPNPKFNKSTTGCKVWLDNEGHSLEDDVEGSTAC